MSPNAAARGPAPSRAKAKVAVSGAAREPEPWPVSALLTLVALALAVQCLVCVGLFLANHRAGAYAWYVVLLPYQFPPLVFLVSFVVAMPLARRLTGQPRSLGVVETLAVGAVALLLVFVVTAPVGEATLQLPWAAELAALAASQALAYGIAAAVFPLAYRRFWMPRRRRGQE